jgi:SAM-dependent methyltransferase
MNTRDAVALVRDAVAGHGRAWADLGAGDGTFTRALVELLGSGATVYAVERDVDALAELRRWATRAPARVVPIEADFTRGFDLTDTQNQRLDGLLFANSLHFVNDPEAVLSRLVTLLRPRGRVVFVEYDRRERSRWVPYPIPSARLPALARAAGLSTPTVTATRPSLYSGTLYVAAADRAA